MIDKSQYEIFKKTEYVDFKNNGKKFLLNKNLYLDIVFNDTCNSRCRFCVADLIHNKQVADVEQFKSKIKFAIENMGVREVLLLGGEPTINDNIFIILDYLKQFDLDKICITTNGFRMSMDYSYTEKLFSSGITHVNISLMNKRELKQMEISRTNKSISEDNLREIKRVADKHNVKIRINNNVFLDNNDTINDILSFYDYVSPYCHSVKFSPLLKTDNFSTINEVTEFNRIHTLSDDKYESLFNSIEKMHFDFKIHKNAETFGFVEYSLIEADVPIILNYNHRGQMMDKVVNENKINNLKLLTTGDLSLSWNRELSEYFINTDL